MNHFQNKDKSLLLAEQLGWLARDLRVLSLSPCFPLELTPGGVDSACYPSDVGEISTSLLGTGALYQ